MKPSFVSPILARIARRLGVKISIEPKYGYAGQIVLPDGRMRYFRGTNFDLNLLGASEIARDKAYAAFFLKKLGYPVPEGEEFFTPRWCKVIESDRNPAKAYRYARETLDLPVIVKPNNKSQGRGVCLVHDRREFRQAIRSFETRENVFLVQEVLAGRDFRIVVLDDEVVSAYERLPLSVVGDGHSTVLELLLAKQAEFDRTERDTRIAIGDFRITNALRRARMTRGSVLPVGQRQTLLPNANLSTGGDAVDVTEALHPAWRKLAVKLVSEMGLRYCGLDVMVNGTLATAPRDYVVLEINAAPGLDHYASTGSKQKRLVEKMYEKVLRALLK